MGIPPPAASGELPPPEHVWLTIWKSAESFGPPGTPPIETLVMVSGRSPVFETSTGVTLLAAGVLAGTELNVGGRASSVPVTAVPMPLRLRG